MVPESMCGVCVEWVVDPTSQGKAGADGVGKPEGKERWLVVRIPRWGSSAQPSSTEGWNGGLHHFREGFLPTVCFCCRAGAAVGAGALLTIPKASVRTTSTATSNNLR